MTNPLPYAHSTRRNLEYGRVRVDPGNTAFWEGKEFRISREFVVGATPLVFKFDAPVDFILQSQSLTCDIGNIRFRAYRAAQGVESGTFDIIEPIYQQNGIAGTKGLDSIVALTTGGTFTPNEGEVATETIRLRVSNSTSGQTSVSGTLGDERGLPSGVYYLELARIDGNDTATGVFDLKWEERRPDE